jgi:LPXTG-motif cell wall-anchored protein
MRWLFLCPEKDDPLKKIAIAGFLAAALLVGTAAPSMADSTCTTTTTWTKVIDVPFQEAVYQTTPAVYVTEYEFVHKHPDHPNSPRWELEGWNADGNPNSIGWYSTGNTRQTLVTPETTILITPEVPEVSHMEATETEVCEEVPPVVQPPAEKPPVVAPPVAAPPVVAPVAPPVVAPVAAVTPVQAPEELAQTGTKEEALVFMGLLAMAGILAGAALLVVRRKIT